MVRQDDEGSRLYIEKALGISVAEPFIGLLIERCGEASGAAILNDYTPSRNIEITVASSGPWSIADVRGIARYCFARVERITARTSVNNHQAIERLNMLGFKYEGCMRQFFASGDAAVFGLLKSEQRILK